MTRSAVSSPQPITQSSKTGVRGSPLPPCGHGSTFRTCFRCNLNAYFNEEPTSFEFDYALLDNRRELRDDYHLEFIQDNIPSVLRKGSLQPIVPFYNDSIIDLTRFVHARFSNGTPPEGVTNLHDPSSLIDLLLKCVIFPCNEAQNHLDDIAMTLDMRVKNEISTHHQEHTKEKRVGRFLKDATIKTRLTTNQAQVLSKNYDAGIKEKKLSFSSIDTIDEWSKKPVWGLQKNLTRPNPFFWESYSYNTDVETSAYLSASRDSVTFGGSSWDGFMGLKNFDYQPKRSISCREHFKDLRALLNIPETGLSLNREHFYNIDHMSNLDANPGPTFLSHGYRDKREILSEVSLLSSMVARGELPTRGITPIRWGLGGRGKPTTIEKVIEKTDAEKAAGRSIWMADTHELGLAQLFTVPLNLHMKTYGGSIDIGKDFNSQQVKDEFSALLANNHIFFSGDWSAFDASLPPSLIHDAFLFLADIFNIKPLTPLARILSLLEDGVVHSEIVCPNRKILKKHTGLASGSGLTSIIGSICNLLVFLSFKKASSKVMDLACFEWDVPHVLGDDNLISLRHHDPAFKDVKPSKKLYHIKLFASKLASFAQKQFGMTMHPDKSRVSYDPAVRIFAPFSKYQVADGSVYSFYDSYKNDFFNATGVALTIEKARSIIESGDPAYWDYSKEVAPNSPLFKGKRFTLRFSGTVKYLSRHFYADGTMVRPKEDLMRKLTTPTTRINTIREWRNLLLQYMMEYGTNPTSQAELESLFCDTYYAEKAGIYSRDDALKSFEKNTSKESIVVLHLKNRLKRKQQGKMSLYKPINQNTRQFWITERDTYPVLSDPRFDWIRPQLNHLKRLLFALKDGATLSVVDIARCRSQLTKQGTVLKYHMSLENETFFERMKRSLDDLNLYPDYNFKYDPPRPFFHQSLILNEPLTLDERLKFLNVFQIFYGLSVAATDSPSIRDLQSKTFLTRRDFILWLRDTYLK